MKHRILTAILLIICAAAAAAQGPDSRSRQSSPAKRRAPLAPSYAWTASEPLGLHEPAQIDTLFEDYHRRSIPSAGSPAWATTGNLGTEGIDMIYLDRPAYSDFFFRDGLARWLPSSVHQKFYNTRAPMTLLSYNAGGGRDNSQERLGAIFSGNINARAQIGANLDYLYSKGSYEAQAAKDLAWGFNGSYMGDRYEFQGAWNHYNLVHKENGGITDDLYITDPAQMQGGVSSINPKSIPVNLTHAHTRVVGGELMLNSRYKVGYWHEDQIDDTTTVRTYIPVSSFIWTLNYRDTKHLFLDDNPSETSKFFDNRAYLNDKFTRDRTTYWALSNTIGVDLIEGFHRYAKFGLAAYATYEIRKYRQTPDTLTVRDGLTPLPEGIGAIPARGSENLAWVGAQLTKQRGSILTYAAKAELGVVGRAAGEIKIDGHISTRIPLLGDTVAITGFGAFTNTAAPYLMENYISNHFAWRNTFGKERRVTFGGRLDIPHTGTAIKIAARNVQNLLYFDTQALPAQHSGSIQVFTASLDQRLRLGILHWDNRVIYQTSSDDAVLSLPKLALRSSLYIRARIATLHFQLGLDCDYYTRYHAPAYQPATATFHNQREALLGNYPFMTAYANMKLSKVRFYVMMTHINQGWFSADYFSLPHYPLNPRRFQMGLSIDFAN